jgi:hypothetical protein
LFESSGGQRDQTAHLPELRFALGEPEIDTTSIDNAAFSLETKGFYIRKAGTDGFRFGFKPTLKNVVSDRRASLDRGVVELVRSKEFHGLGSLSFVSNPARMSELLRSRLPATVREGSR